MKHRLHIGKFIERAWSRDTLIVCCVLAVALAFMTITTKIPGFASSQEISTIESVGSLKDIFNNPVNAPYKIAVWLTTSISPSVRAARSVSFLIFIATSFAFYYAMRHWHTKQIAILSTLLFSTNSIVLATARLGTPLITIFSWFIFTALGLWQLHSRSNKLLPLMVLILFSVLLYTPGALWFSFIFVFIFRNRISLAFRHVKRSAVIVGFLVAGAIMAPLIISFVRNSDNFNQWLLLPDILELKNIPRNILRVPSAFIYKMPDEPLITVGRLPVFDLASGILFLIGLNAYRQKLSLDRTKIMIGSAVVGIIVGALGQLLIAILLLLPFAFSVIGAGLEFLVDEWHSVFPRNPIAKGVGSILITTSILFGSYYHVTRFFVVWPQTPEVRAIYNKSRQTP